MRITCRGVAKGASRSHRPAALSTRTEGCRKAVLRRSAPASASEVTGGAGSMQVTRKPAAPKAEAAVSPATPPPQIRISVASCAIIGPSCRPI